MNVSCGSGYPCITPFTVSSAEFSPPNILAENCLLYLHFFSSWLSGSDRSRQVIASPNDSLITFESVQLYYAVYNLHCYMDCPDNHYGHSRLPTSVQTASC